MNRQREGDMIGRYEWNEVERNMNGVRYTDRYEKNEIDNIGVCLCVLQNIKVPC